MMTNDEIIAVVQAHKVGKVIEWTEKGRIFWQEATTPCWDFHAKLYRVKPEPPKPREFWINVKNGSPTGMVYHTHNTRSKEGATDQFYTDVSVIRVREVLGE